jgi:hypothetical protein
MVKRLEGVQWVEETTLIMMDDDAYFAHIKVGSMHLIFSHAVNHKV